MEQETIDRVEHVARAFAVVLVTLSGAQTLCDNVVGLLGPFGAFAALACVGLSWHAQLLRGCLHQHPRVFVVIAATCVALMTAAFLVSMPTHTQPAALPLG